MCTGLKMTCFPSFFFLCLYSKILAEKAIRSLRSQSVSDSILHLVGTLKKPFSNFLKSVYKHNSKTTERLYGNDKNAISSEMIIVIFS